MTPTIKGYRYEAVDRSQAWFEAVMLADRIVVTRLRWCT